MQNLSYQNGFDLHEKEPEGGTQFHVNGFTQRLILTQRQKIAKKGTQKWPIKHCTLRSMNRLGEKLTFSALALFLSIFVFSTVGLCSVPLLRNFKLTINSISSPLKSLWHITVSLKTNHFMINL